ncbi:MAG: hypothetical protein WBC44_18830 [Planctomycetaceae bacterium]
MRRLFLAAGIGLSTLTATAQLPPEEWFSSCDGPSATCVSPHIEHLGDHVVRGAGDGDGSCGPIEFLVEEDLPAFAGKRSGEAEIVQLAALFRASLLPIADDADEILSRWSLASQSHLPVTDAERLRLQYASPERSGQELSLSCELQGPVDDAELNRRYDWTVTDDADAVELTAIPKDGLERLFYDRFTVTLDAATWRPTAVRFETPDLSGRQAVALRPWVDDEATEIQVVAYRPPSVAEQPIRTADVSEAAPRLLHNEPAPLELPPAPAPCEPVETRTPIEAPKP